ncbi:MULTISPECIES: EAL domain-containing response regulator [unclassified Salinivibrio]|uniref:EAL domain-containing response regulator n=1 Tax=unclassified Salinivibrio TaxID=2636825 RepID=UPI001F51F678|nr:MULTISPECIES: EAL domain-containing response regulator [unclassified Salinivibrio]
MTETQCQILIVDDQKVVRHTLSLCLRNLGYEGCYEASNGKEAKRVIEEHQIDVIFCDLNMPVEDGFEVLRYLGASHFQGAIVLMSSEEQDVLQSTSQLARLYHLQIIGCLPKPLTAADIKSMLLDWAALPTVSMGKLLNEGALSSEQLIQFIEQGSVKAYFQPQIDLNTQAIQGFEVLARIEESPQKILMPDLFIPAAEGDATLILALTKSIIQSAYEDVKQNWDYVSSLSFSFNISGRVLEHDNFPNWLKGISEEYSIPTQQIVCELTETALNDDQAITDAQMLRMRMLKFKLSIDDFGTGYSSIAQLHAIPFNELKIDKCFIFDCLTNSKSATVVEQSVKMAKALGLTVVAEGVESAEVVEFLRHLGCDSAQGYFYAKPAPMSDFISETWFINRAYPQ